MHTVAKQGFLLWLGQRFQQARTRKRITGPLIDCAKLRMWPPLDEPIFMHENRSCLHKIEKLASSHQRWNRMRGYTGEVIWFLPQVHKRNRNAPLSLTIQDFIELFLTGQQMVPLQIAEFERAQSVLEKSVFVFHFPKIIVYRLPLCPLDAGHLLISGKIIATSACGSSKE